MDRPWSPGLPPFGSVKHLALALALGIPLTAVPASHVAACSCEFDGYAEAIAEADFAFIGTVVTADEPEAVAAGSAVAIYQFRVVRARGPMVVQFDVTTPFATGEPNCGFNMDPGQQWLVIATDEDGPPRAEFCNGTTPVETLGEMGRAAVDAVLTVTPADFEGPIAPAVIEPRRPAQDADPDAAREMAPGIGTSLLLLIAAIAVIGIASLVAFRRDRA